MDFIFRFPFRIRNFSETERGTEKRENVPFWNDSFGIRDQPIPHLFIPRGTMVFTVQYNGSCPI